MQKRRSPSKPHQRLLQASLIVLASFSCRNVSRFDTRGEEAYCGSLVSGPAFHAGFVPTGEPPNLRLKLTLDTSQLASLSQTTPVLLGALTTDDAERGICASETQQPMFRSAPLRAIPEVHHDAVSTLSFGDGHDEDLFAWADSTCQGTMLALISLLRSGDVELRLFKPAPLPPPDAGPEQQPGFALFYLKRNDQGCDF
jgi:hypothetical protein